MENRKPRGFDAPELEPVPQTPVVPAAPTDDVPGEREREGEGEREREAPAELGATFNPAGYAAQANANAVKAGALKRSALMRNADLSYGIMKAWHGNTVRTRPLIVAHAFTPLTAPKVGVVINTNPEQYTADKQSFTPMTTKWRNGYGADIVGSNGTMYTPVAGDVGKRLSVYFQPSTAARPSGISHVTNQTAKVAA